MAGGHTLNIKQGPGPRNGRHPSRIRAGQRFSPLAGSNHLYFTVKGVDGEWVRVEREDRSKGRVSTDRLLASDSEGNGINYRFHGWTRLPRGYRTELAVLRVDVRAGRSLIALPEWDPSAEVEVPLASLPVSLRDQGAKGSCRADLTAVAEAGLELHQFSTAKVKGLSRCASDAHPGLLAEGQEFRRRTDGKRFRLLDVEQDSRTVPAWADRRVVRLEAERLLATNADGQGAHYAYIGGGVSAARRRRAHASHRG